MIEEPRADKSPVSVRVVDCPARVKALEPLTSTQAPSMARVVEYSANQITIRTTRSMIPGTLVQLHVERNFSLWRVRSCVADGDSFAMGLELAELVRA